jgi:hypothetical protein
MGRTIIGRGKTPAAARRRSALSPSRAPIHQEAARAGRYIGAARGGQAQRRSARLACRASGQPARLVTVALANKLARIIWAMIATGEAFRSWRRSNPREPLTIQA